MAGGNGAWGIDIGQCGIKALRATLAPDGESVVAEAFDFIEYPKILSQPDAKPDELVREALQQFLSRNNLRGDKVAISLSGQSGLARFVSLPPVDAKKIPNIVAYEAKQQIPFALEDVIWDYQQMPGGTEEEGFALESEVGIFAMKRDQVFRLIRPLIDAEVELDIIQLTPLSIYNMVTYDMLSSDKGAERSDSQRRPIVVLSMGTDTSDLVVTDGYRVWQRSIPLGGNHFTKQLTKELKLTFAKAEQVKRNARKSDDAKAIFQAMRPVFNDLVTEVHRSLGFYQSLERSRGSGEPKYMVVLGNAVKLAGLPQYLEKNLEIKVLKPKDFKRMTGATVIDAPAFKDNLLSFAVCYGLALQGLGKSNLRTNLLPREILRQRLIRRKKPWAAAIAAALLLGCAFNFFFVWRGWASVNTEIKTNGHSWQDAKGEVDALETQSTSAQSTDGEKVQTLNRLNELGEATVGSADGRFLWLELMKMVSEALPRDETREINKIATLDELPLEARKEIYIDSIESVYFEDLTTWLGAAQPRYAEEVRARKEDLAKASGAATTEEAPADGAAETGDEAAPAEGVDETGAEPPVDDTAVADATAASDTGETGETGEGESTAGPFANGAWVISIKGKHFYKEGNSNAGAAYVRNTLLKHLDEGTVELPLGPGKPSEKFTSKELGIYFPFLAKWELDRNYSVINPNAKPAAPGEGQPRPFGAAQAPTSPTPGGRTAPNPKDKINVVAFKFEIQFAWTQVRMRQRLEQRENEARSKNGTDTVAATE